MKNLLFVSLITLILINCKQTEKSSDIEEPAGQIVIGQIDSVYSNILGESRKIWVYVPDNYLDGTSKKVTYPVSFGTSQNIKYPVLFLLDGRSHFYSVTGMIRQLSSINNNKIVPKMIVIGILNTNRWRDLSPSKIEIDHFTGDSIPFETGGGNRFLDFIEKELIPHVEQNYPATPYRTFVGHSLGGLSVLNALMTRPNLFNNYVSIDPSLMWDNRTFLMSLDSALTTNQFNNRNLYLGVANSMQTDLDVKLIRKDTSKALYNMRAILDFTDFMEKKQENGLNFSWKYYDEDTHGSVPLITEYDAFKFLFPWYSTVGVYRFLGQDSNTTAEELIEFLNAHYKNVSVHFGYSVIPPEEFINGLGYLFMQYKMIDKASALFDLNIKNYPNSSNVYDSRGDCYLAQQDSIKALEYFTKALEVGDNDYSQPKIDMLKENLKQE